MKKKPSKTASVQKSIGTLKAGGSGRKDGREAFNKLLSRASKPKAK